MMLFVSVTTNWCPGMFGTLLWAITVPLGFLWDARTLSSNMALCSPNGKRRYHYVSSSGSEWLGSLEKAPDICRLPQEYSRRTAHRELEEDENGSDFVFVSCSHHLHYSSPSMMLSLSIGFACR
jgi:hypothetical protein